MWCYVVGYKIPAIENLGVTEDLYESIDFSDNELLLFDNFPILNKLVRTDPPPPTNPPIHEPTRLLYRPHF